MPPEPAPPGLSFHLFVQGRHAKAYWMHVDSPVDASLNEYDFGSTTELALKVVGVREQGTEKGNVMLLALNDMPETVCDQCGACPATQICTDCEWSGKGWLCDDCAAAHECGEDMFLPVVNSPRTGVCGYAG
ncbi:MAG: hypothetical protein IT538_07945 [Variibacter sp.]|nr:hypothetical protein [Variibacter sp.]